MVKFFGNSMKPIGIGRRKLEKIFKFIRLTDAYFSKYHHQLTRAVEEDLPSK